MDYRGNGMSSRHEEEDITIDKCVSDAIAVLDEHGWKSCWLLGHGFGGFVGQQLALQHPSRIERLALAGTPNDSLFDYRPDFNLRGWMVVDLGYTVCVDYLLLTDKIYTDFLPRFLAYGFLLLWVLCGLHPFLPPQPGFQSKFSSSSLRLLVRAFDEYTPEGLDRIKQRTLLMYGARDKLAPEQSVLELEQQMVSAVAQDFDGGHFFLIDDPTALQNLIDFFRACESNRIDEF
jgi:pimeloyl-ACP methyl ester carboxylesterase